MLSKERILEERAVVSQQEGKTRIVCYALHPYAPRLVPAQPQRQWMDDFPERQAYRCLPMAIANAYGWDILCPVPLEIDWNGGPALSDLSIRGLKPLPGGGPVRYFCQSHFTSGIVTMHVDYIFRTDPGWNLLATGPFNRPKENAYPLTGIVDTDQLPYPFTMNWQLLRPGRVFFEEDEPFCSIFPVRMETVAECQPEMRSIVDDPELRRRYEALRSAREEKERSGFIAPAAVGAPGGQ
jgi:hypothetical protein